MFKTLRQLVDRVVLLLDSIHRELTAQTAQHAQDKAQHTEVLLRIHQELKDQTQLLSKVIESIQSMSKEQTHLLENAPWSRELFSRQRK
jgi:hypothetical protein